MRDLSVGVLAEVISAKPPTNVQTGIAGVSTDSRTIRPGECFFAVSGPKFDGHDYVAQVFAEGAACAVVSRAMSSAALADKPILVVKDTIKALADLARYCRRQSGFKVVGITGSVGKTTTRQIVHHVLSRRFKVHQSPKSFNNQIGVPLTLLSARPEDEIVVAELGTNHPGEIAGLTQIAEPDIAVVTNVYPAHLEGFGSLDAIAREKLSIAESLARDGVLLVNGDIELVARTAAGLRRPFLTFGMGERCDYRAEDIHCQAAEATFTIDGTPIHLRLPGQGNVYNALCAWAICSRFGISLDDFAEAIEKMDCVPMRLQRLQFGTLTVLNDCYNANPASMKNALEVLSGFATEAGQSPRRLVFVCGDMRELGGQSEAFHRELGEQAAHAGVALLIAIGQFAPTVAEAARAASTCAGGAMETACFPDALAACDQLHKFVADDDIILVKGSRAAGLETVIEKLQELFTG